MPSKWANKIKDGNIKIKIGRSAHVFSIHSYACEVSWKKTEDIVKTM